MSRARSATRRLALRLVGHASRVLPDHRSDWARAIASEVEHLPEDLAALQWAIGAVFASYLERVRSFDPGQAINTMRSFLFSVGLVLTGLLVIEVAHVVAQFALQDRLMRLLESLPTAAVTTDAGSYAPLGIMLATLLSAPLAVVAYLLGRALIQWVPARARAVIKATIAMDAAFLTGAMLVNFILMTSASNPSLEPSVSGDPSLLDPSLAILWLIRVLFVAAPLAAMLRIHRHTLDAAVADSRGR